MKTSFAVTPKVSHCRHYKREKRREKFLQIVADKEILLPRLADDCSRLDRIFAMKERIRVKDRIIVRQRVITVMVAEWSFGASFVRRDVPAYRKLGFSDQAVVPGDGIIGNPNL